ncbi:MAG: hypothetical protein VB031_05705 [Eubacteriaceae bacterium]|nr:hypothetical protein [Eubacteriaceae bacterium]
MSDKIYDIKKIGSQFTKLIEEMKSNMKGCRDAQIRINAIEKDFNNEQRRLIAAATEEADEKER